MLAYIDQTLKTRMESIRISPPRAFWCMEHGWRNRHGVDRDGHGGDICIVCKQPITKIVELAAALEQEST